MEQSNFEQQLTGVDMKFIGKYLIVGLGLLVGFSTTKSEAQFEVGIAAGIAALGALTLDRIFTQIENNIVQAQAAFEGSGNRLVVSAAEQSNNMLKQLKAAVADEREKTFQQISNERKLAIWDLYNLTNKLRDGVADDFAKDVVQVHKLLSQIAFIGKDVKFLIVRIGPPIITKQELAANPIRIFGVGFGVAQAGKSFETAINLGGKNLPKEKVALKEWGVELAVQSEDFGSSWKTSEYGRVPMKITSTIKSDGSWWCRTVGWRCSEIFSAEYHFDLYPTNAAELVVRQRGEETVLAGNEELVQSPGCDLPNLNNPRNPAVTTCPHAGTYGAGDGWKWVRFDRGKNKCNPISGNGCPFVPDEATNCNFFVDNTQAQCSAANTGGSVSYQFGLYKRKVEKKTVLLPDLTLRLLPGETKKVEVERSAVTAWVDGQLPFGQGFGPYPLKPAGGTATSEILCTFAGEAGDKSQFDCAMRQPW